VGRPLSFDRAAAVETVMNEIWRRGYEACSAKALAEALGITRSSFYNTFESREALFEEVLALYVSRAPDHGLSEIREGDPVLPRISGMFREISRVRAEDNDAKGCLAVNAIAELVGVDETLGPYMEEMIMGSIDRFERLVRQAAAQGEIPSTKNARGKALALQNLLVGLNVLSKVIRSEKELWAVAKEALEGLGLYAS